MIELWEILNGQVHWRTKKEREQMGKLRQIRELNNLLKKGWHMASRYCFTLRKIRKISLKKYTKTSDYMSMHKKAIINSANEWKKCLIKDVKSILSWLQNSPKNTKSIERIIYRHCSNIIQPSNNSKQEKYKKDKGLHGYVNWMMNWLRWDPENEKTIEHVEKQQRKRNQHGP